jgi:hypothetical protein
MKGDLDKGGGIKLAIAVRHNMVAHLARIEDDLLNKTHRLVATLLGQLTNLFNSNTHK